MNDSIIVAFISAIVTISIAIWTFFTNRKNQKDLEILKSELAEKKSFNDARRDYEFEARKRLYQEYEPLFFQLIENSKNAFYKVKNIARDTRNGVLDHSGWTSRFNYYVRNTIYKVLAPVALFKIMQRKLTFVDLKVDSRIEAQFHLSKLVYILLTEDFALAKSFPKIDYDPNNKDWKNLIKDCPEKYSRQGFPIGILDKTVELLITEDKNGERLLSYGEFEELCSNKYENLEVAVNIFMNLNPINRPVLWRILMAQIVVYKLLLQTNEEVDLTVKSLILKLKNFEFEKKDQFYLGLENDSEHMDEIINSIKQYFCEVLEEYFSYKI